MASPKRLEASRIHPDALAKMSDDRYADTIREIEDAIAQHRVVVVGMAQNPHVRRVRRALSEARVEFHYLEYGSYLSQWSRRLSIKLWSGWRTFPQVFVDGTLIGGADLTEAAIAAGTLSRPNAREASAASEAARSLS